MTDPSTEPLRDACAELLSLVNELDVEARAIATTASVDTLAVLYAVLDQACTDLSGLRRWLGDALGERMTAKRAVVPGLGAVERHARRDGAVRCIDESGLWRSVLDTRVVDDLTGEVLSQADVIRLVYGVRAKDTGEVRLTGATPTKVDAVGIPSEHFFEKGERVGWTIQLR